MSYTRRIVGVIGGGGGGTTVVSGMAAVSLLGNNTSGALALVSSGTLRLAGGNNITLSQNGQSVTISGGNSNPGTFSIWEPQPLVGVAAQTKVFGQSSLQMFPLYVPVNLSVSQMMNLMVLNLSTSSNSSYAVAFSQSVGIYTLTGSTLNLITASSGATNFQMSNTSNQSNTVLTNMRGLTMALPFNATPGNYWIGHLFASASTNANWVTFGYYAGNLVNSTFAALLGATSTAGQGYLRGLGNFSAATAALPATINMYADFSGSQLFTAMQPYMQFQGIAF